MLTTLEFFFREIYNHNTKIETISETQGLKLKKRKRIKIKN